MESDGSLERDVLWNLEMTQDLHCAEEIDLVETEVLCSFNWPDSEGVERSSGFNESNACP